MKITRSICRILLAGLIVTAGLSCWNPLHFKDGYSGNTLTVYLGNSNAGTAKTIFPDLTGIIENYRVTLSRAGYVEIVKTVGSGAGTADFSSVPEGNWDITVEGLDGDGNLVAQGTATADVSSSGPASASVTLEFLDDSGVGTITLELSYPSAGGVNTVEGTLIDSGDISEAVAFTVTPGSAALSVARPSGIYTLIANLKDASANLLASIVESVHVYGNMVSEKSIVLAAEDLNGAPSDPTGLNLTQDQTDVNLSWTDNAKTETGYAVERSTDGGSSWSALAAALAFNTVAYSDTTTSPGATYHYRVRAANTFGASGWLTGNIVLAVVPLDPWNAFIYSDDGVFQTKKAGYPASSVTGYLSGLDSMGYDSQNTWVNIDSDVTVSSASDDFTGGYVEVAVGSATTHDDLRLVGNGGSLTVIDAAVYWNGSRVGTIDNTKDGQDGSALRIDFSTVAPLANAGFETGDLTGWTVDYTKDQMQGQSWAEGHVFPGGEHDATPLVDDGTTTTLTAEVVAGAAYAGSWGLRLAITGTVSVAYGTSHGPSVTSSAFFAQAGDSLSLFWQANMDGDDYDVFGFVFKDANDNANWDAGETYQKLFHGTGATTGGWIETTATLDFGGNDLRFWFINGNWDATGGMGIGSSLYIDGITLNIANTATATNAVLEAILENVQYRNDSAAGPATERTFTVGMEDSASSAATGSASTIPLLVKLTGFGGGEWTGSEVWKYVGGSWSLQAGQTVQDEFGYVRDVTNPDTEIAYRILENTVGLAP